MSVPPLVTPRELLPLLEHSNVVVLDATWSLIDDGPKSPRAGFERAHVPGALLFEFRRVRESDSPLHETLCSADQFQTYVRSLGISDEHVVCYSQTTFSGAARAWWMLRVFGHDRVSVLHGGLTAWRDDGLPIEEGPAPGSGAGTFDAHLRADRLCALEQVESRQRDGVQLVDARPPAVFRGDQDWFAERDSPASGRPGRIAGALNLPSATMIRDGRLAPVDELERIVRDAGVDPTRPTVASCSLGVGASGTAFVLHLLGNESVAVFDGSWEAWAAADEPRRLGDD